MIPLLKGPAQTRPVQSGIASHPPRIGEAMRSGDHQWSVWQLPAGVLAAVAAVLITLGAAWPGLYFPLTFDEAYNLALVKHFAATGSYATAVFGTPRRWFDPFITTGPTELLPVALVFKLFRAGIIEARTVALAYLVLFVLAAYLATRSQTSPLSGSIALVLLTALSYDLYDLGLRVLGEVPSLAFLCLSTAALSRSRTKGPLLSGIFLALALLTKPQMAIAAGAYFAVVIIMNWHDWRQLRQRMLFSLFGFALPLLVWHAYQLLVVGPERWVQITAATFRYLTRLSGIAQVLQPHVILALLIALVLSALLILTALKFGARRLGKVALGHLLAGAAVLVLVLAPLPLLRWNLVSSRFSYHWQDHPLETGGALVGLSTALAVGIFRANTAIVFLGAAGILFTEWYLGISERNPDRYSVHWRVIGLVQSGVALDAIVTIFLARIIGYSKVRFSFRPSHRLKLLAAFAV